MPVSIHNRDYWTVAERIAKLRDEHPDYTVETQLIFHDSEKVIMKALIYSNKAMVLDQAELHLVSTGYAEEIRGSSTINTTSALENAETSAVGRALAFFGLAGTEIASADEVAGAIASQHEKAVLEQWAKFTPKVEEHHDTLLGIREFLAEDNFEAAREAWNEVNDDDKHILWRATTKGGWFTPREREQMKYWSNEFENA